MPAIALNILYCPSPISTHESPLQEKAKALLLVNLIGRNSVQEIGQPMQSDKQDKLQEKLGSTADRFKRCPPPSADTGLNSTSLSLHSDPFHKVKACSKLTQLYKEARFSPKTFPMPQTEALLNLNQRDGLVCHVWRANLTF